MSLLTVSQVSKSYFSRVVLDQVSFRLDKGERLALIGDNGAGKTTLIRLIIGAEQPDTGSVSFPFHVIPGYLRQHFEDDGDESALPLESRELDDLEQRLRSLEGQMAETDSQARDIIFKRYSQLTARYETLGGYDFARRMEETLAGLGLAGEVLSRPLPTLSGGERMRVALARLLLRSPDLLLLDEPTNHLDLEAMEWLEDYLTRFKGAVILVSHDRAFIDRTATAVGELAAGRLVIYPGNYSHFREIQAAARQSLDKEILMLSRELGHQTAVKQTMLSHRNMSGYHAREKVIGRLSGKLDDIRALAGRHGRPLNFQFQKASEDGDPKRVLLRAENLAVRFGDRVLFRDVSFFIRKGIKIFLCGPNGCGKTTLLSLLMGKIGAFDGNVSLPGGVTFGHMGQHVDFTGENRTLLDEILWREDLSELQARSLLARYGFRESDVFKKTGVLSGGERARLYLCCLLLERPELLFLDEPTNHLDIPSREILENALREFTGAILAVSHDRYFIERCADSVLGFVGGEILPFDQYAIWRQAVHTFQAAPEPPPRPRPDAKLQPSRAQERRETALHREKVRRLEQEIARLEQARQETEESFIGRNDPDIYLQYDQILSELDRLYDEYLRLESADQQI